MPEARTFPATSAPPPAAATDSWARVLFLADDGVAARAFDGATAVTFDALGLAPCLRLRADDATERAAAYASVAGRTLLLTALDLHLPDIPWVLGYANRRRRAAVVSIARLRDPRDDATTIRRARNVAAHERGHLQGLSHCRDADCVMRSANAPGILDGRGDAPCARCSRALLRRDAWVRNLRRWLPGRERR